MKNAVLILMLSIGWSLAANPGIRLRLTDKGLAYGKIINDMFYITELQRHDLFVDASIVRKLS